jgi:amino acid transporter
LTWQTASTGEVYKGTESGLHTNALGPIETLAQSLSAVAPSTSPSLTIPLVFAMAGNATWFVYLLAMMATLLVGFCVSRFARISASPGSLYSYTAATLSPVFAAVAAWGLLLAYLATGASVAGGAVYYARLFGQEFLHYAVPAIPILLLVCAAGAYVAWRDVKLSAELMLWMEAFSVGIIVLLLTMLPLRLGVHLDTDQFQMKGISATSLGPALVLALFSFVGFESATTLGGEVRNPLRTIPRAVIQCALIVGVFFALCAYSEVLGFRSDPGNLASSTSPLHQLAIRTGLAPLGTLIDAGAMISMIACVLACTTAASRVLLRMASDGLIPLRFGMICGRHGTPSISVVASAGLMLVGASLMSFSGISGSGIYDLMGSLAVLGFLTAYALVAIALPFARRELGSHARVASAVSALTVLVLLLIVIFDLRSVSDQAHARLPVLYLVYIVAGLILYSLRRKTVLKRSLRD